MGRRTRDRNDVGNAVRRWGVAALASLTLATSTVNSEDWANFEDGKGSAALEEAFFETLGRCESPLLVERNEAEDALFERFAEFEPIWQDRRFLTNGEIGAEARQRFELAEARYREKASNDCVAAFETTFETVAPELEERKNREEEGNEGNGDDGGNEKNGGNGDDEGNEKNGGNRKNEENKGVGENGESGETLRGFVRLRWEKPMRIVYLSPDWSAFERRDGAGKRWRPSGRFSVPELAPEFDASELTLETTWERVADEEAAAEGKVGENGENGEKEGNRGNGEDDESRGKGEGKTTVVGVWEGLIGGDFRVWTLPLGKVAIENALVEGNRQVEQAGQREGEKRTGGDGGNKEEKQEGENGEKGGEERKKGETAAVVERPSVFRSGDAVATVGETSINANGETTARVRLDFAEAFDAFDSHRVLFDKQDFGLIIDESDGNWGVDALLTGSEETQRAETETRPRPEASEMETRPKAEGAETETRSRSKAEGAETETRSRSEAEGGANEGKRGASGRRWAAVRWRVRERSANGALFELDFPNDATLREAVVEGRARLACRVPRFFFRTRFEVAGIEQGSENSDFNGCNGGTAGDEPKIKKD